MRMNGLIRLVAEFVSAPFRYSERRLPTKVEAVWVLSGPEISVSGSNGQRISKGLQLAKQLHATYFIFNGVPQQNRYLKDFLAQKKWSFKVITFNCTDKRVGNTYQQVQCFAERRDLAHLKSIVIVSHLVHLPRIKRYLIRFPFLIRKTYFFGVGLLFDRQLTIISELKKLIRYSRKGDLDL